MVINIVYTKVQLKNFKIVKDEFKGFTFSRYSKVRHWNSGEKENFILPLFNRTAGQNVKE